MSHRFVSIALAFFAAFVAFVGLPSAAQADVTGDAIQSANIQPMIATNGDLQTLESKGAKAVYCQMADDGFNRVTMIIPLFQDSPQSTVITARKQGPGTSPTPTDAQLVQAIRNAKACDLKVILKPHLELPGGEWRAHIKGTKTWQKEWDKWLLRYAKIAKAEGVEGLVIGTEQKGASLNSGSATRWKNTIAQIRKVAPKLKLTYAAHTNDELLLLPKSFVKKLDYISATWYPRPPKGFKVPEVKNIYSPTPAEQKEIDKGIAALQSDMKLDKAKYFDKTKDRYGKKLVFAETGFRSIDLRDYYIKDASKARPDALFQSMQYQAMFNFLEDVSYVKGVMIFRVFNTTWSGGSKDATFTWQNKIAEQDIKRTFTR